VAGVAAESSCHAAAAVQAGVTEVPSPGKS